MRPLRSRMAKLPALALAGPGLGLGLGLVLGLALPVAAADRALVVGIGDYSVLGLGAMPASAPADAAAFAAMLQAGWGFAADDITLLTDAAADADAIMTALIDKLVGETAAGDRVVFYFAGLGTTLAGPEGAALPALVAHDADKVLGKIPADAVSGILDILVDRDVTVVIDASFTGDTAERPVSGRGLATRGLAGETLAADAPAFGAGLAPRAVWNAATPGTAAWEDAQGGVFTRALVAAAPDAADNSALLAAVAAASAAWCAAIADCVAADQGLVPVFSGPAEARPGFVAAPAPAEPAPMLPPFEGEPASFEETLGLVTDLFAPANAAGVRLTLGAAQPMKLGDLVSFRIGADRAGEVMLFDINPAGELTQVYPSAMLKPFANATVLPDRPLSLPQAAQGENRAIEIRAGEPLGRGILLAILVEGGDPTALGLLPAGPAGGTLPGAGREIYELARRLIGLQAQDAGGFGWSAAFQTYEIVQ